MAPQKILCVNRGGRSRIDIKTGIDAIVGNQADRAYDRAGRSAPVYDCTGFAIAVIARDHVCACNARVRSIACNEVHERRFVSEVVRVVHPADIRHERRILGCSKERPACRVQLGRTNVATSRDVEGADIEGQTHEVVLHPPGDEFVDFVCDLSCEPTNDRARTLFRRDRILARCIVIIVQGERIEEGLEQAELVTRRCRLERPGIRDRVEVRVIAVDRLGQHRVSEAIDDLRKFGGDRGVNVRVMPHKWVLQPGERGNELVEHDPVVLHLRAEPGSLEHALAVPLEAQRFNRCTRGFLVCPCRIGGREREDRP